MSPDNNVRSSPSKRGAQSVPLSIPPLRDRSIDLNTRPVLVRIDHVAITIPDREPACKRYTDVMGAERMRDHAPALRALLLGGAKRVMACNLWLLGQSEDRQTYGSAL